MAQQGRRSRLRYDRVEASLVTRGRWGWEGKFRCLPTLRKRIGAILEWIFELSIPILKVGTLNRDSAGVVFTIDFCI